MSTGGNHLIFHDELISSRDHPLLLSPPYNLTLPIIELITPKENSSVNNKKNKKKQKDQADNIPRPHNAFILFRIDYAAKLAKLNSNDKVSIRVVSQLASKQWKKESEEVKLFFKVLSDLYHEQHKILYPSYKFAPKKSGPQYQAKRARLCKNDEFKKNKECMITWYVHENFEDENKSSNNDSLNNSIVPIVPNYPPQQDFPNYPFQQETIAQTAQTADSQMPATFVNYTASPSSASVTFHSTTTTSSLSYGRFNVDNNSNNINNNLSASPSSLPTSSSPPSHLSSPHSSGDGFYWGEQEMNNNLTLLNFDNEPLFF